MTWTEKGVFIFDPFGVDVVLWTADIKGMHYVLSLYCVSQKERDTRESVAISENVFTIFMIFFFFFLIWYVFYLGQFV